MCYETRVIYTTDSGHGSADPLACEQSVCSNFQHSSLRLRYHQLQRQLHHLCRSGARFPVRQCINQPLVVDIEELIYILTTTTPLPIQWL